MNSASGEAVRCNDGFGGTVTTERDMGAFDISSSFASLSAWQVETACREYLEARKRRISAKRETLIDAEMRRRFFRPKTREAAEKRLKDEGAFGAYAMAGVSGGYWADRVENLRNLALAAGDGEVVVCADDASVIVNFLTPNYGGNGHLREAD